jgi:alpha-D-ribose 1-methylphosphonate 5-triphosphate synthase subunit PhnH
MGHPQFSEAEARSHQTFRALMDALSRPGQIGRLPASGLAAFSTIADALLDLETSYHTPDSQLLPQLARTGARALPPGAALYQFYPRLGPDLGALAEAPAGTYADPDQSATLVIGCTFGAGRALRLRGPGIAGVADLWVDGVPDALWELRERICRYPLGWDIVLVAGGQLAGLPRTTRIEVE